MLFARSTRSPQSAVRGLGLLCGVEFRPPKSLRLRISFEAFTRIHPAMFGQVLVMRLFRGYGILCQICGNNFMVLKVAPPLIIKESKIDEFVAALGFATGSRIPADPKSSKR